MTTTIDMNPGTNENAPYPAPETASERVKRKNRERQLQDVKKSIEREAERKTKKGKKPAKAAKAKAKKVENGSDYSATEVDAPKTKNAKAPKKEKAPKQPKPSKAEAAAKEVQEVGSTDVTLKTNVAPSIELNTELQTAFEFFNRTLFASKLAPVMFSNAKRLKRSLGHHWPASWDRRTGLKGKIDEIGLDFTRLREEGKGDKEVLSTLVHEMCHQLVSMTGRKERGHGHMWCAAMRMVGLEPIILDSKGVPTGKATGPNSSHSIEEGGAFDKAADELIKSGFKFSWFNKPMAEPEKKPAKKKKAGAKAKHVCPHCEASMWGKPSAVLYCHGTTTDKHDPVEMECDREAYEGGDNENEGE